MNVIVQSKTLVVTEAIRNFARHQVERLTRRDHKISRVTVFLENVSKKRNDLHAATAKILVDLPGKNVVVQERSQNLYDAIGQAARAAAQQVNRMKKRKLAYLSTWKKH